MKKPFFYIILILALLGRYVGALPRGREMEELSLITTLAADQTDNGIKVTAVTGVRAGESAKADVLTGTGKDFSKACQDAQKTQALHAYFGQTGQILLGEDLARSSLMEILAGSVLDGRELRLDTFVYIVKGDAGKGLSDTAPKASQETPGEDKRGRTAAQLLAKLCAGETTLAPVLAPNEEGFLLPAGWAVLSPAGLTEFQDEKGEIL